MANIHHNKSTQHIESIERMDDFFTARVDMYDGHMLTNIQGMQEAYARIATLLPAHTATLLDLGCGTGLELASILKRFPSVQVTGIDMTQAMLDALQRKYTQYNIHCICGDYFTVDFSASYFDAALSVQSLHHFTHEEKRGLYRRILHSLKPGGIYIETDYIAKTQAEEDAGFQRRIELLARNCIAMGPFHIDVPCTAANQVALLKDAGFVDVHIDTLYENMAVFIAKSST